MRKQRILLWIILIMGLSFIFGFFMRGRITHEPFDSEKWKSWTQTEETMSLRWDMMNSLRNNHDLIQLGQSEIIDLLGEPDAKTESEFNYSLGSSKRGIHYGTLTIKFDENAKVVDYSVHEG